MAGAGYKLYLTGDVLSATDVNNYLQEQTVMSFATSAARTSALSLVLAEGMMSYLQDSNSVQVYNGTAWVAVGGSSPLTTKGDLYGFSTLDARVPIGTNNQVLTADSAQALGLKWATPASGGKVLQVSSGAYTSYVTTTSNTYSDINAATNVSFTCSSVSSKVLIIAHINEAYIGSGSQNMHLRVMADSTAVLVSEGLLIGGGERLLNFPMMILYSPASTAAITYKLQFRTSSGGTNVTVNQNSSTGGTNITLLEIGA